jgi:hypothetical protein
MKQAASSTGFLLSSFFSPEDGGDVTPKRRLTLTGLQGNIFLKIGLLRSAAVRTSTPTEIV